MKITHQEYEQGHVEFTAHSDGFADGSVIHSFARSEREQFSPQVQTQTVNGQTTFFWHCDATNKSSGVFKDLNFVKTYAMKLLKCVINVSSVENRKNKELQELSKEVFGCNYDLDRAETKLDEGGNHEYASATAQIVLAKQAVISNRLKLLELQNRVDNHERS